MGGIIEAGNGGGVGREFRLNRAAMRDSRLDPRSAADDSEVASGVVVVVDSCSAV